MKKRRRTVPRTQTVQGLRAMRYAWMPEHILNPAREPVEMRIERDGALCRAYALPGEKVREGERSRQASEHFFGFFSKDCADVTGGRITVTGVHALPGITLIERLPGGKENAIPGAVEASLSGDTLTIIQKGWQKKYFVRISRQSEEAPTVS